MEESMQRYREDQARRYLASIYDLAEDIEEKKADIEYKREMISGLDGIDYSKPIVTSSANGDKTLNGVIQVQEMIRKTTALIAEWASRVKEADDHLRLMGGKEARVLRYRYLQNKAWPEVAKRMGVSERQAQRLAKDALFCFYDYMPCNERERLEQAI